MPFKRFIQSEHTSGALLFLAAVVALLLANSSFAADYQHILHLPIAFTLGGLNLSLSIQHWINDGLMALFFLVVGLEIKREILGGELSSGNKAALPVVAALGGVVAPALIYMAINRAAPANWVGWAIPTATDIAFALGLLAIGGRNLPTSLKVFLTALAILDDLIAILIIALFYGGAIHIDPFFVATGIMFVLLTLNLMGIKQIWPYLLLGFMLWLAVMQSGLHATLAGVMLAIMIPIEQDPHKSPLHRLEHALHPVSALFIMPLFALANAGFSFEGMQLADMFDPLPLGIMLALFIGKPLGIFFGARAGLHLKWASLPEDMNLRQLFAVACLAGVGFTMSLFIGTLAFPGDAASNDVRLGVIVGSVLSAVLGVVLLRRTKS